MAPPLSPDTQHPSPLPQPRPVEVPTTPAHPTPPPTPTHEEGIIDRVQHLFQDLYQRGSRLFSSAQSQSSTQSYASRLFGNSPASSQDDDANRS